MDGERKAWERMEGEPLKWFSRFDKFRIMKPWERSVNAVFEQEETEKHGKVRTKIAGKWYKIAEEWKWNERAEAWDKHYRDERDKRISLEEEEISKSEFALKHNRIKELNDLAKMLKEEVDDDDKRWVDDIKAVGFEAHHLKKFNDALVSEYRATFDDIAKEKGERVKMTKQELTGKDDASLLGRVEFYAVQLPEKKEEQKGGDSPASSSES